MFLNTTLWDNLTSEEITTLSPTTPFDRQTLLAPNAEEAFFGFIFIFSMITVLGAVFGGLGDF